MRPAEVFLSHASADRSTAIRVVQLLQSHGIPVYYAPHDIVGARQWQNDILHALRSCDWFLVLLTSAAVESMWVQREVAYALKQRRFDARIVPLLYQDCELKSLDWLDLFQRIDLRNDFRRGCAELLRIWGIGLRDDVAT